MSEIILDSDPNAARFVENVSGWVSRDGHFYGQDERLARYAGSTHKACACGNVYEKQSYCRPCSDKRQDEKFAALPKQEWEDEPLCLFDDDTYFFDLDSLQDYCEGNEIDPQTLRLVICKPQIALEIDVDDYCSDLLPEDQSVQDVAPELYDALMAVNKLIRDTKPVLSWMGANIAAILPPDVFDSVEAESATPKGPDNAK